MRELTVDEMYALLTPEDKRKVIRFVDKLLAERREAERNGQSPHQGPGHQGG